MRRILIAAMLALPYTLLGAAGAHAQSLVDGPLGTLAPPPPTITDTSKPDNPSGSDSAQFGFTGEPGAAFDCRLDGAGFAPCEIQPVTPPAGDPGDGGTQSYSGLADGFHTFEVRQRRADRPDQPGITSEPASYSWWIAAASPGAPRITAAPADPTNSTAAHFEFDGQPGASFQCDLDGTGFAPCDTQPVTPGDPGAHSYVDLAEGSHAFQVKQIDGDGNESGSASHTWTVDLTPPEVPELTDKPADPTNQTSASFSFSGEPGAEFRCRRDGALFEVCTSPRTYNGLANGQHSFDVYQIDAAGNSSSTTSFTWTVDTGLPPAPTITAGPANPSNSTTASFAFSANEPGGTLQCKLDAASYATCDTRTNQTYTGLAEGSHTFQVRQVDDAGSAGAAASHTWIVDTTANAPTLTATPTNPSGPNVSFSFTGETGATFQCDLDGAGFAACGSPKAYNNLPGGSHTFSVRQTDPAGNLSAPASFTWTVDATGPASPPTITSTPPDPGNSVSAPFEFTGDEPGGSFECKLDAQPFATCVSPKEYNGLSEGAHTFQVRQKDALGNPGPAASHGWTVNNASWAVATLTPSTPTIGDKPPDPSRSSTATFTFLNPGAGTRPADNGASFECRLDAGNFSACASPKTYNDLATGTHTFSVRSVRIPAVGDAVPANASAAATYTWTIDALAPPAPTITVSPPLETSDTTATFEFTGTGAGSFECDLDGAGFEACESPKTYSGLADGSHTFDVREVDPLAGPGPSESHTWTVDATANAPTLTATPTNPSGPNVSFSFTGETDATFQCDLDGDGFAACGSPQTYNGLADGSHTFSVRQTDTSGNVSGPAVFAWQVDAAGPLSPPTIDSAPTTPGNSVSASFEFTGDEPGGSFECTLDAQPFAACVSPKEYTNPVELGEGPHTFQVRQKDALGNPGPAASHGWTVNNASWAVGALTPPQPRLDKHPPAATRNSTATFEFSSPPTDGSDPDAINSFECRLDAGAFEACVSPKTYANLPDGAHAFAVRRVRVPGAGPTVPGNASAETVFTWTVDQSPPGPPTITVKPPALSNSASPSFEFTGEPGAGFRCRLDSGSVASCESPKTYAGAADGSHTFRVFQIDAAGNTGSAAVYTWVIDTVAPGPPSIVDKPAAQSASRAAHFSFSGTEAGASLVCRLDSDAEETCDASGKDYSDLADGQHTLSVLQRDSAGNDSAAASYTWVIDATAPTTTDDVGDAWRNAPTVVTLSAADAHLDATYYTTDGSDPKDASNPSRRVYDPAAKPTLANGERIAYYSTDTFGNAEQVRQSAAAQVDTQAPGAFALLEPADATTLSDSSPTLSWEAAPDALSGIASYEILLDGAVVGTVDGATTSFTPDDQADGEHIWVVRAIDRAGNSTASSARSFTIDTSPPPAGGGGGGGGSATPAPKPASAEPTPSDQPTGSSGGSGAAPADDERNVSGTGAPTGDSGGTATVAKVEGTVTVSAAGGRSRLLAAGEAIGSGDLVDASAGTLLIRTARAPGALGTQSAQVSDGVFLYRETVERGFTVLNFQLRTASALASRAGVRSRSLGSRLVVSGNCRCRVITRDAVIAASGRASWLTVQGLRRTTVRLLTGKVRVRDRARGCLAGRLPRGRRQAKGRDRYRLVVPRSKSRRRGGSAAACRL